MGSGIFLQLLVRGLITGTVYALVGVSWGMIYNTTRTFHFAHGFVYALTAHVILLATDFALPFVLSVLIALSVANAADCALEYFIYLPMRQTSPPVTHISWIPEGDVCWPEHDPSVIRPRLPAP